MSEQAKDKKKRRSSDVNQRAASIVMEATSDEEAPAELDEEEDADDGKNPAAVALGRLGGKKGGKARAESLSPERRRDIAKKAAAARWGKKDNID